MRTEIIKYFKSFQWRKVIELSDNYLKNYKNDYEINFYFATALFHMNELELSEATFSTLIELFPEKYQGYEGLAKIYMKRGDTDRAISQWWLIMERFPKLKHAYNNLGLLLFEKGKLNYATCVYEELITAFPDTSAGYEGLIKIAKYQQEDLDPLIKRIMIAIEQYPNSDELQKVLVSLEIQTIGFNQAFHSVFNTRRKNQIIGIQTATYLAEKAEELSLWGNAETAWNAVLEQAPQNENYVYRYGKLLQHTSGTEVMLDFFQKKVLDNPKSFLFHKGLIEAANLTKQWEICIYATKNIVTFATPAQKAEAYSLSRIAYMEKKLLDELDSELKNYLNSNSEHYKAWKTYASIPSLRYDGTLADLHESLKRSEEVSARFPQILEAQIQLGLDYLALSMWQEADCLFQKIIKENQTAMLPLKHWATIPLYAQNWQDAVTRMRIFRKKFPSSFYQIFYPYIYALYHLGKLDEVKKEYIQYCGHYFQQEIAKHPFWFKNEQYKIECLLSLHEKRPLQDTLNSILDRIDCVPEINDKNISQYFMHAPDSGVLIVCFSGMDGRRTNTLYKEKGLNALNDIATYHTEIDYDFIGFARVNTQYNFLLLRDNFNCWYQIHTQKYINIIKETVKKHQIKKLVFMGTSAGGFAALFFGQLLRAHLVFAYGPQTLAWTNHGVKYHKACELLLNAGMRRYNHIKQLQYDAGGFIPKTFIHFGKNCTIDLLSQMGIDEYDKNLTIVKHDSDRHAMHQVIGKRKMFTDICREIDTLEIQHDFLMS